MGLAVLAVVVLVLRFGRSERCLVLAMLFVLLSLLLRCWNGWWGGQREQAGGGFVEAVVVVSVSIHCEARSSLRTTHR